MLFEPDPDHLDDIKGAIDEICQHLPVPLRTAATREEIARRVLDSAGRGQSRDQYRNAARAAVIAMFASFDCAFAQRGRLVR